MHLQNNAQITLLTLYVYLQKRSPIVNKTWNTPDGVSRFHSISHGRKNMQIRNLSREEDQLTFTARKGYINLQIKVPGI